MSGHLSSGPERVKDYPGVRAHASAKISIYMLPLPCPLSARRRHARTAHAQRPLLVPQRDRAEHVAMAKKDEAPPMIPGDAEGDRVYMEAQGVDKALALALAQIIREKPENALARIAQLISPETYSVPNPISAPPVTEAVSAAGVPLPAPDAGAEAPALDSPPGPEDAAEPEAASAPADA